MVCDPEELLDEALRFARVRDVDEHCSPRAMAAIRRQIFGDLSRNFGDSMVQSLALMEQFAGLPDFAEGVKSSVERRPPRFAGLDSPFRVPGDPGH